MPKFSRQDVFFMRRCLELAQKGEGRVSPNPLVGAVIVKGGKKIAEGWHAAFGGPHAEAVALAHAGKKAAGATLYVSLEPCPRSFSGKKTPPCVPLIIKSGISRVVVAARDPNPRVAGRGTLLLRSAGLLVECGLLGKEAHEQNEAFSWFMKTGKPFVAAKMAQSSDGKIGVRGRGNLRISGKKFDAYSHLLRNRYDAIAVGINTVLADNPRLNCRTKGGRNPARIVLDSSLRIPLFARVLRNAKKGKVIIATSGMADREKKRKLLSLGATVMECGKKKASLRMLLSGLPSLGIHSVLLEGGAEVIRSAISQRLANRAVVAISPGRIELEGAVASPFTPQVISRLRNKREFRLGKDTVIEGSFRA